MASPFSAFPMSCVPIYWHGSYPPRRKLISVIEMKTSTCQLCVTSNIRVKQLASNWQLLIWENEIPTLKLTKLCGYDYKKKVIALLIALKVRTLSYLFTQKAFIHPKSDVLTLRAKCIYIKTIFVHFYYWFYSFPSIFELHYWIF